MGEHRVKITNTEDGSIKTSGDFFQVFPKGLFVTVLCWAIDKVQEPWIVSRIRVHK